MWRIDKDLESREGEKSAVGVCSQNYVDGAALPHRFSLFDGDGECYYQGRTNDDSSFAPLDDFGEGYAGCTEIKINGRTL